MADHDTHDHTGIPGVGGSGTVDNGICEGRLTLTTGVAVTTSDVTAATTLYFTPYKGNRIATYSGSAWSVNAFTEKSITLATLTAGLPYDVYIVDSTLALELVAWTNGTTRATGIALQDGVYVKSGTTTRRYLGTVTIAATGQSEDSLLNRLVWNMYNRVPRRLRAIETDDSWTSTATGWRAWNGDNTNRVTLCIGVSEDPVQLIFAGLGRQSAGATVSLGVGLDSTSANSATIYPGMATSNTIAGITCVYDDFPGIGSHFLQLLEYDNGTTTTFYGDINLAYVQGGATGRVWA